MEQIDKSDGKFRASSVPPVSFLKGAEPNGDDVFDPQSHKPAVRLSSGSARMVEVCLARVAQNDRTMAAKEAGEADACRVVVEQGVVQGNALALIEGLLPETDGEEEEKKKKKRHSCLA